jgi:transcriptional regulator with XRE-family HTH domain
MEVMDRIFGVLLREWRGRTKRSQLALAMDAGISQRHLSFLESGRSHPSRETVLKIARALDLPLRSRNDLLLAAGYAPHYPERSLDDAAMRATSDALARILYHHEPYPAMVLDGFWNVVKFNSAASRILARTVDTEAMRRLAPDGKLNFLRMVCSESGLKPRIRSWTATASALLGRLRTEAASAPGCPSENLLHDLLPSFPASFVGEEPLTPVIPMELEVDGKTLSLFNTLTTFGTPQDVTLQELRVEMSFPMDDATDRILRTWASAEVNAAS